ncbi:MAG: sulfatase-like hydrolase/transferase [Myxococcales bacterium]|nr:sulfatase-like hydrolase/transferase [Myxococcales bacterium]
MRHWTRFAAPAALAALAIVLFEIVRTLAAGDTALGGGGAAFALAVVGVLGLPLWGAGALILGVGDAARAGWRWGREGGPAPEPARVAAWVVFGLVVAAILLFGVQGATVKFVKAFRKPIYQGLGAGLAAVLLLGFSALIAGPVVALLTRALRAVSRRLPRALDPTSARGAAAWAGGLIVIGVVLAPVIRKELATVDLRPLRLLLAWLAALVAARWWIAARPRGAVAAGAALAGVLAAVGAVAWARGHLGDSQSRLLALDRDTLIAGRISGLLARLGDGDGDGVPGSFAGGDCDDANPAIRPGVYDAPEDGVDQNCTGADLRRADDPLHLPRPPAPAGPVVPWNVVFLTVDTVRADIALEEMPRLRALAEESVDFTQAYAHGASTYWSIPALMTSTVPSRLDMGRDQTPVAAMTLLAEVLRDKGWHTALFANVTIFFIRGLRQGTHTADYSTSDFTVHGAKPGSAHLTDGMLRHVDAFRAGQLVPKTDRFFLWGHYYDPHDPYFEVEGFPADGSSDEARYRAILRYTDVHLGRLIDGLKERGLWDSTLLVITADHGDEFLDHGHRFHGHSLYEEMVHVPLVMHVPGVAARRIDVPIGHMEVGPTLLDLLGLPTPRTWIGRSRADEIRTGTPASVAPVFFEALPDSNYRAHQVGVRVGPLKLIQRIRENYFELYDLQADPLERRNLFDEHPEAPALQALLGRYLDHHLAALARGKTGAEVPPGSPQGK